MQGNEPDMHVELSNTDEQTETPTASMPPPRGEGVAETSVNAGFVWKGCITRSHA